VGGSGDRCADALVSSLPPTPFDDLDAWSVLRPQEIDDRLRVDVRSVRRVIAAGVLPASRTCGVRVLAADAAAWWRASAVSTVSQEAERAAARPAADRTEPGRIRAPRARGTRLPLPPRGRAG
jgi:hypothetical protein